MVKTVTTIERERVARKRGGIGGGTPPRNGPNGNGSRQQGGEDEDGGKQAAEKAHFAMWFALASILMLFAALVSAYIFVTASENWRPVRMPSLLWLSTALIAASSLTFSAANRALKRENDAGYFRWLLLTVGLGLGFLISQLLAWKQLVAQGVYLAGSQHRNFFYVLTGVHAVHLLGGILALGYLLARTRHRRENREAETRRHTAASIISIYWHFMDGLWVFLFLLLLLWK